MVNLDDQASGEVLTKFMPHCKKIITILKNEPLNSELFLLKWSKDPVYSVETKTFLQTITFYSDMIDIYRNKRYSGTILDSDGEEVTFDDEFHILDETTNTVIFRKNVSPPDNLYLPLAKLFSKESTKPFLFITDRRKFPLKLPPSAVLVEFNSSFVNSVFFYETFEKRKDIDLRSFQTNVQRYLTEYYDITKCTFDVMYVHSDDLIEFCNYHSYFKFNCVVIDSTDEISTLYLRACKISTDRFIVIKNCIFADPTYMDYNFENHNHGNKLKIFNYPKYLDQKSRELKSILKYSRFNKHSEFTYPKIDQKLLNNLPIKEKIVLSFQPITLDKDNFLAYQSLLINSKDAKLTFEQTVNNALLFLNMPQCLNVAMKVELEERTKISIVDFLLGEKMIAFGKVVDRMNKRFVRYRIFLVYVPLKPIKNKELGHVSDFFYDCITNKTNFTVEIEICILDDMIKRLSCFSGDEELVFVLLNGSIFDENKLVKFYMGLVNNYIHKKMSVNIVQLYADNTLEQKMVKLFYENLNFLLETGESFKTIFKTTYKYELDKEARKPIKSESVNFDVKVALLDEDLSEFEWALLFDKSLILMHNFIKLIDDYQVETTLEQITGEKNEFGEKVASIKRETGALDKKLFTSLCLEYGFLPHVRREIAVFIYHYGVESENLTYLEKLNNVLRFKLDGKFTHGQLGTYLRELNRILHENTSSPDELKSFLFDYDSNGIMKIINIMKMYRMFLNLDKADKFEVVAKKVAGDPAFANSMLDLKMGKTVLIQLIRNLVSLVCKHGRSEFLIRKNYGDHRKRRNSKRICVQQKFRRVFRGKLH